MGNTTTRLVDVECEGAPPLFPITLKVEVPAGVPVEVVTVIVDVPALVVLAGLNVAVTPAGKPELLNGTLPVNPFSAVTVTV